MHLLFRHNHGITDPTKVSALQIRLLPLLIRPATKEDYNQCTVLVMRFRSLLENMDFENYFKQLSLLSCTRIAYSPQYLQAGRHKKSLIITVFSYLPV